MYTSHLTQLTSVYLSAGDIDGVNRALCEVQVTSVYLSAGDIDGVNRALCEVQVTGVYPSIVVTDAHCYGSAVGISKRQLWTLFSIDK